jgi:hypothetical protein
MVSEGNYQRVKSSGIVTPCSLVEAYRRTSIFKAGYLAKEETSKKQSAGLAYSSTLKTEAIRSSEISVDFYRSTRRYVPQARTLHSYRCEHPKSMFAVTVLRRAHHCAQPEPLKSSSQPHPVIVPSVKWYSCFPDIMY